MNLLKNERFRLTTIVILSLLTASILLFFKDPYYGHDIGFHLSRIQSIADCLNNKTFPALIYPNYFDGYGYANGIFYPDLFLYIPALLSFIGIDTKIAYQIFLFIINIACLLSMYFCIKKITTNGYTSTIIACLYLLNSYRICDLYVRSALGETLCFIFFPFVMLGLYEIFYDDYKQGFYLTIGLCGVLFSHIISLLFCIILVFVFVLIHSDKFFKDRENFFIRIKYLIIFCIIAVGISSFFSFPFIEAYFADEYLVNVLPATGGYTYTIPFLRSIVEWTTISDIYFPPGIGIVFILLLYLFIKNMKADSDNTKTNRILIIGLLFLVAATDIFPWILFKKLAQIIQFPWRFLIVSVNCLFFGFAPSLNYALNNKKKNLYTFLLACTCAFTFICFFYNMYMVEEFRLYKEEIHYSTGGNEYLPADIDLSYLEKREQLISKHPVDLKYNKTGTTIIIDYSNNNSDDNYLELPLIYYKGYKTNDNQINTQKSDNGLVEINLNKNSGSIEVYYGFTLIRVISLIISLFSLFILVFYRLTNR